MFLPLSLFFSMGYSYVLCNYLEVLDIFDWMADGTLTNWSKLLEDEEGLLPEGSWCTTGIENKFDKNSNIFWYNSSKIINNFLCNIA